MKTVHVALLGLMFAPGLALADLGVSVNLGEPGFYGRLDIGDTPRPRLIYAEPVIIERVVRPPPPVYVHVPPGQEKKWRNYCHQYDACGRPVYFVRDSWYNDTYVPVYREKHGKGQGGKYKDYDNHEHGHGNNGNGHGKGNGRGND